MHQDIKTSNKRCGADDVDGVTDDDALIDILFCNRFFGETWDTRKNVIYSGILYAQFLDCGVSLMAWRRQKSTRFVPCDDGATVCSRRRFFSLHYSIFSCSSFHY
jgi:hypothetical protein